MEMPKPQGLSVEVQARLFGAAQAVMQGRGFDQVSRQFLEKEAHAAAADVAGSSGKIIGSGLSFSVAGEEFSKKTELGRFYYEQALNRQGPLYGLAAYSELSNVVMPTRGPNDLGILDVLYEQRIARNIEKVVSSENIQVFGNVEGYKFMEVPTYHVDEKGTKIQIDRSIPYAKTQSYKGIEGVYSSSRVFAREYAGVNADEALTRVFERINKDEMLLEFDQAEGKYKLPSISEAPTIQEKKDYLSRMQKIKAAAHGMTTSNQAQIDVFKRRIGEIQEAIDFVPQKLRQAFNIEEMQRTVNVSGKSRIERAIGLHETIGLTKKVMLPVMGFGLAMSGLSALESFQQPERSSLLIPSYHEWFEQQAQMFGSADAFTRAMQEKTGYIEGMQESGLSASLRKVFTDFGSPYTGPSYSDNTLQHK